MLWLMVGLIVVAVIYVVSVLTKYNSSMRIVQNKIGTLEKKTAQLEKAVKREGGLTQQKIELVRDLRSLEADLKQELALTEQKLKTAQMQESNLEMDMYKREFKKSKQRSY